MPCKRHCPSGFGLSPKSLKLIHLAKSKPESQAGVAVPHVRPHAVGLRGRYRPPIAEAGLPSASTVAVVPEPQKYVA